MAGEAIELNGILLEDGTVVLERSPPIPPGPVRIRIESNEAHRQTPAWQTFQRIWAEQRARGYVPRSKEEIDADIAAMREGDEERMEAIERLQEECIRLRQQRQNRPLSE
jgi:hypothetical protein